MTLYLDTSHLVKLYVDEEGSGELQARVGSAQVVATSSFAYAETRATFARRRSEALMTAAECTAAIRQFDADWPRLLVIQFDADLTIAAGRLADRHGIRGADAVHLASFERLLSTAGDDDVEFSGADERLNRAAKNLG